jgi:hypothetical protein
MPGGGDRASVDSDEVQTPLLIEREGIQIVVGGDEPESSTARALSRADDGSKKSGANAAMLAHRVEGHEFTCRALDRVGRKTSEI